MGEVNDSGESQDGKITECGFCYFKCLFPEIRHPRYTELEQIENFMLAGGVMESFLDYIIVLDFDFNIMRTLSIKTFGLILLDLHIY